MNNIFSTLIGNKAQPETAGTIKTVDISDALAQPSSKNMTGNTGTMQYDLPKAQPQQPEVQLKDMSTADLVKAWQKDEKEDYTAELLSRMKPTISSAFRTYAPGMENRLAVKAANLTLDALRHFNPTAGTEPSTWVYKNLHRLTRFSAQSSNIISVSEAESKDMATVRKAVDDFIDRKGRDPSVAELADLTGLSRKKVDKLLDKLNNVTVSESSTLTEDNQRDTVSSSGLTDNDYFEYVYMSVDPISQKIMEWTSGLHGKPILSNNQIAEKLHMSPAAVSQRKNKIEDKLSDIRSYA